MSQISQTNPVINYFEPLPFELLYTTFSHLSKKQKVSLMRVCRLWKGAVLEVAKNQCQDLIKGIGGRIDKHIVNKGKYSSVIEIFFRSNVIPADSYFLTGEEYPQPVDETYEDTDTVYYKQRKQLKRNCEGVEKEPSAQSIIRIPLIQEQGQSLAAQHKKFVERFPGAQRIDLPYPIEIEQHPAWHGQISRQQSETLLKNTPGKYLFRESSLHSPQFKGGTVAVLSHIDNERQCLHNIFYITKYAHKSYPILYQFDATSLKIGDMLASFFLCDLVEQFVQTKTPTPAYRPDIEVILKRNSKPSLKTVLAGMHFR